MNKKLAISVAILVALTVFGYFLYATNAAPKVAELSVEPGSARPFVVKLHAQWCPVCRMTKDIWNRVEEDYSDRVNLVILDFTNEETTQISRERADRIGIRAFFDESSGVTGAIVVLDGRTKEVRAWLPGRRKYEKYAAAIDEAISSSP